MSKLDIDDLQSEVRALLAPFGFVPFGWFAEEQGKPALLIGNVGSSFWSSFQSSDEYSDKFPDSLNRWTQANVQPVAYKLGAHARYPFGEKIWPFQQYAKRATGMKQSPIGLLIHPQFGLWTAFRAVLVFSETLELPDPPLTAHPCDTCLEKPCLSTCPIDAFADFGYDYDACKSYLVTDSGALCFGDGCIARNACPVGREYANLRNHQAFHMSAYV